MTRHGKLLTFDHIVNDIDIYVKICTKCDTPYRYQEFDEGFHNFDDMLFLSYDMLIILHESVAKHIAIGSLAEVFGHRYESKINPNKIVHAYQHFDALCDKAYNFNCVICAYHPKILTVDVNRKTVFGLDSSSIESTENKEDLSDFVNAREFWENVKHHIIASPLGISEYTEHQKINKGSGELEQGTREMTEERLLELLYQEKANSVRGFGKSLGIKNCDKQQKHEIIRKIRDHIIKDNNKFNKIFRKFWGTSGGYLTGVCPHKVVYFVKFLVRAEGRRDYIDLLLSIKYQSNILISDMPQIIASHGNKRQLALLHHTKEEFARQRKRTFQKPKTVL